MDINSLPGGLSALVDANIFIYYLGGVSTDCKAFLRRVALGEVEAHITTAIVAEVVHRRMMAEAVTKGLISPGQPLKKLKANPTVIPRLTDYIMEIEKLLRLPLRIAEISVADIAASHDLRRRTLSLTMRISSACPAFKCGSQPTFDQPLARS